MFETILKVIRPATRFGLLVAIAANLHAAIPPLAAGTIPKPCWLTELSLGLKESYDDNVFLAGADPKYLPAAYAVPAGSVAALQDRASWVTTVSPKIAVNFAPLLGDEKTLQTFSLAYAPDFVTYHDQSSESYEAHRVVTALKGRAEAFSFSAENTFSFVDGNSVAPFYPGALYNVYMSSFVRERREQLQDKATVTLQYDWQKCFIRPTATLSYYDLMTEQINVTGYQNYTDRYDVNGGVDFGWKIFPQLAVTIGYRYGHQDQQQFVFSPYSSPSDYQRVLVGIEGKPWSWLDVKIQVGPDFRDYEANSATHITPVNDFHPVKYYGEATLTATLTSKDSLAFKYKQWQWVSSTGKVPYFDSTFDLSYHRQLTTALDFDLGGKILSSDYTSGNLTTCRRNDFDYVASTGVTYAINRYMSLNLAYSLDSGRNGLDGLANESTRSFNRNLISLGAVMKF